MHVFSSHTKYMVVRFCFHGRAEYFVMGVITAKFGVIDDGETLFSVSTTSPRQRAIGGMPWIDTCDANEGNCIFHYVPTLTDMFGIARPDMITRS